MDKGKRQTIYQTITGMAFNLTALKVLVSQKTLKLVFYGQIDHNIVFQALAVSFFHALLSIEGLIQI